MQETAAPVGRPADPRLLAWLADHDIDHEVHRHPATMTAAETARAEHVDPHAFAKTVVVRTSDGRRAVLTVEASDRVDLAKAAYALEADAVHLLQEPELIRIAPDVDPGAWPPVGSLFGLPVLADHALREDPEITFCAGSHSFGVRVDRAAWEGAADVRYADLAEDRPHVPAWIR